MQTIKLNRFIHWTENFIEVNYQSTTHLGKLSYREYLTGLFHNRTWIILLIMLVVDLGLYLPLPAEVHLGLSLILFFFLPGWSVLSVFAFKLTQVSERFLAAIGISLSVSLLLPLYLIYLQGTIAQWHLLLVSNIWVLVLQGLTLFQVDDVHITWPSKKIDWPLLLLLGLSISIRWPRLWYSEFHEDEIEVLSLVACLAGGEDYALFLHRKGPLQMLLPLVTWLNTNFISEGLARFPFLIASVLGVWGVYTIAQRLASRPAAITAAALMAVNGFSVAFSRLVQYQALLLFLGPLTIWAFWWAYQQREYYWTLLGALFLAICTLGHYDILLYLPVVLYLVWLLWQSSSSKQTTWLWLLGAGTLYLVIVISFYLPYIQDPKFADTLAYLADKRIGNELLYNNRNLYLV
jgi:hypothetical protein